LFSLTFNVIVLAETRSHDLLGKQNGYPKATTRYYVWCCWMDVYLNIIC